MFSFERAVTNRRKEWTAAATVVSGYMASEASKDAAQTAKEGQMDSAQLQLRGSREARDYQKSMYYRARQDFLPYREFGQQGISQYGQALEGIDPSFQPEGYSGAPQYAGGPQFGGGPRYEGAPQFQAPDPSQINTDPSYQFRLNQGMEATTRALTKSGQAWGGQRGIALTDYAQKAASQEYQNIYNRALQTYGARRQAAVQDYGLQRERALQNYGIQRDAQVQDYGLQRQAYQQDFGLQYGVQQDYLNRLQGQAQLGYQATGTLGQIGSGTSANVGQTIMQGSQGAAAARSGAANAQAAGQIGQARAWGQSIEALGAGIDAYGGGTNNYSGIGGVNRGSQQDMMLAQQNQGLY